MKRRGQRTLSDFSRRKGKKRIIEIDSWAEVWF